MKKTFLIILLIMISTAVAFSRQPERGYRGFIEWDNTFGRADYDAESAGILDWIFYTGIATSHGYQFNSHVFLGGGLDLSIGHPGSMVPVFADFRYDAAFRKFTPFGDVRLGYNMASGGGIYLSPAVGYRFNWDHKTALNIGVGCTVLGHTGDKVIKDSYDGGGRLEDSYVSITTTGKRHIVNTLFSVRIGIEF